MTRLRTIPRYGRVFEWTTKVKLCFMNKFLVKEEASEQQVARMLDSSVEGISEAGSVAHVLALDALDAVKDVAKTRCVCVD